MNDNDSDYSSEKEYDQKTGTHTSKPTLPTLASPDSADHKQVFLKCPECNFRNIHPDTIEHHRKYKHQKEP